MVWGYETQAIAIEYTRQVNYLAQLVRNGCTIQTSVSLQKLQYTTGCFSFVFQQVLFTHSETKRYGPHRKTHVF